VAGRRDPDPSANGGRSRGGRVGGQRKGGTAAVSGETDTDPPEGSQGEDGADPPDPGPPEPASERTDQGQGGAQKPTEGGGPALAVPEMTDLYRRLLRDLTERFGGTLDDANADAIAYAAAELYHRDFEPRLWQEKSAHDLLDLFGIPRAGVFAPYSLSDRLVLFQRRSHQAQHVTKAHEVLTALGVPRQDEHGVEQPLKWRLDWMLASVNSGDEAEDSERDADGAKGAEAKEASGPKPEAGGSDKPPDEAEPSPVKPEGEDGPTEPGRSEDGSGDQEPSAAQLVDAVRALEQAAEVEAELAKAEGPGGVSLVTLSETLMGIQGEIAALRELVEAFEIGMRRQLDELQAQIAAVREGSLVPPPPTGPASLVPAPSDRTQDLPPVPAGAIPPAGEAEPEAGPIRRSFRRVLLVVLLVLLGVMIAGGIALAVAVGWDSIRDQSTGLLLP
jgi:hypothetical protein